MPLPDSPAALRGVLLDWYDQGARVMPWRGARDPYLIWISEIMLQQTRVDQAQPYFERFVAAFPNVFTLAGADLDAVLRCWEGLGYYSRARNLHAAARLVVANHNGQVPHDPDALRALPGIGPYTAAAILSIAYGQPHGVLDGNVIRVLTRLMALEADAGASATRSLLQHEADRLVDPHRPGDFNQALMELGATCCTPRAPACGRCPWASSCRALAQSRPEFFPVKTKKAPVPKVDHAVGILRDEAGKILISQRLPDGFLGGLWMLPGGRIAPKEVPAAACERIFREEVGIETRAIPTEIRVSHTYSHFKITLHACVLAAMNPVTDLEARRLRWAGPDDLEALAFDRASRRLLAALTD